MTTVLPARCGWCALFCVLLFPGCESGSAPGPSRSRVQNPRSVYVNIRADVRRNSMERRALEIDNLIATPLQEGLSGLADVLAIRSRSRTGDCRVQVEFRASTDAQRVRQLVADRLRTLHEKLPDWCEVPFLEQDGVPILRYFLRSARSNVVHVDVLARVQEQVLRKRLLRVPGVVEVSSFGSRPSRVEVRIDPDRLQAMGLTHEQVRETLTRADLGEMADVREVGNVLMGEVNATPICLRDVAEVALVPAQSGMVTVAVGARPGTEQVVQGTILAQPGSDYAEVVGAIRGELAAVAKDMNRDGKPIAIVEYDDGLVNLWSQSEDQVPVGAWFQAILPPGTGLDAALAIADRAEKLLRDVPNVQTVVAHASANDELEVFDVRYLDLWVRLAPGRRGATQSPSQPKGREEVWARCATALGEIPDVTWSHRTTWRDAWDEAFFPSTETVLGLVTGPDLEELARLTAEIQASLAGVAGVSGLRSDAEYLSPTWSLDVDAERCARLGIDENIVRSAWQVARHGVRVGSLLQDGERIDVVLKLASADDVRDSMKNLVIATSAAGERIRLLDVAEVVVMSNPMAIHRLNGERCAHVAFTAVGANRKQTLDRAMQAAAVRMHAGYQLQWLTTAP